MGDRTGISWTDATWNPIRGCSRVSQGCVHCYAETVAARFSKPGQAYEGLTDKHGRWNGKIRVVDKHMLDPIRWRRPRKIFVNSMSDLFHENLADDVIDDVFAVMAAAWHHTFQVLTKRPARMLAYMTSTSNGAKRQMHVQSSLNQLQHRNPKCELRPYVPWPLPNVWLGVSAEDQATWDERVEQLGRVPGAVRFVSAEPLLGDIECGNAFQPWRYECPPPLDSKYRPIDWVIIGGESGPGHRPMDVAWAEGLASQCLRAGVPVFVKQDSGPRAGERRRLSDAMWELKQFPTRTAAATGPVLDLMQALKTSLRARA
jgi:protein gp37